MKIKAALLTIALTATPVLAQGIDPTPKGLAKELSEQAKVIADLHNRQDKDRIAWEVQLMTDRNALKYKVEEIEKELQSLRQQMYDLSELMRELKFEISYRKK